jgi:hypothetical protein
MAHARQSRKKLYSSTALGALALSLLAAGAAASQETSRTLQSNPATQHLLHLTAAPKSPRLQPAQGGPLADAMRGTAEDAQDQRGGSDVAPDRQLTQLTAALLLVGTVQAIILALQARVFWVQAGRLKQTVDAMKDIDQRQAAGIQESITQTTRLAAASEALARATDDAAKRQLRAYVNVEKIFAEPATHGRTITVRLRNYGKTPAYDMESVINVRITQVPFAQETRTPLSSKGAAKDTLGPTSCVDLPFGLDSVILEPEEPAIISRRRAVLVTGHITYRDAFGETHRTNLRAFSNGPPWRGGSFCADTEGNTCD